MVDIYAVHTKVDPLRYKSMHITFSTFLLLCTCYWNLKSLLSSFPLAIIIVMVPFSPSCSQIVFIFLTVFSDVQLRWEVAACHSYPCWLCAASERALNWHCAYFVLTHSLYHKKPLHCSGLCRCDDVVLRCWSFVCWCLLMAPAKHLIVGVTDWCGCHSSASVTFEWCVWLWWLII